MIASSKKYLVLDIGNTHINVGICVNKKCTETKKFCVGDQDLLEFIDLFSTSNIIVSSVNPQGLIFVQEYLNKQKIKHYILSFKDIIAFKMSIAEPDKIGLDRLLNLVGAREKYPSEPICVIDSGTATTIDILSKNNIFSGGSILPGAKMFSQILNQNIPHLPKVPWQGKPGLIGKNTIQALESGCFWGYISMINGMIEFYQKEVHSETIFISTGGMAPLIKEFVPKINEYIPNLTLNAMALLDLGNKI